MKTENLADKRSKAENAPSNAWLHHMKITAKGVYLPPNAGKVSSLYILAYASLNVIEDGCSRNLVHQLLMQAKATR